MYIIIFLRYNVKCNPGQTLSYVVQSFNLEETSNCFGQQKCIDWVEIDFINYGKNQRFCGTGEEGQVHVDGENEMRMGFVSNRKQEHDGYLYFIVCSEPDFDQNAVQFGIIIE